MEDARAELWHQEESTQLPRGFSELHTLAWMSPVLQSRGQEGSSFADGFFQPTSQALLSDSKHSKPLCLPTTPWQQHLHPPGGKG